MPFGEHAAWFTFTSDRFDHVSELPPEANAGNRFYGRDVAEFITAALEQQGVAGSFIDEDWGWQVHGKRTDGSILEISIYHNPEEDPSAEDDWALMLRLLVQGRVLGLLPRAREVEIDALAIETLENVFREGDIELRRPPAR